MCARTHSGPKYVRLCVVCISKLQRVLTCAPIKVCVCVCIHVYVIDITHAPVCVCARARALVRACVRACMHACATDGIEIRRVCIPPTFLCMCLHIRVWTAFPGMTHTHTHEYTNLCAHTFLCCMRLCVFVHA